MKHHEKGLSYFIGRTNCPLRTSGKAQTVIPCRAKRHRRGIWCRRLYLIIRPMRTRRIIRADTGTWQLTLNVRWRRCMRSLRKSQKGTLVRSRQAETVCHPIYHVVVRISCCWFVFISSTPPFGGGLKQRMLLVLGLVLPMHFKVTGAWPGVLAIEKLNQDT
jgi:hypothetical protein